MMKKILYSGLLFVGAAISLSSCVKETGVATAPTFESFLKSQPNLSIFSAALQKAQLETFVNGPGPFTWIIPTDEAFQTAMVTIDSLNRMTPGQANYLVQYHIINSLVRKIDMVAQNSFPRGTQLGTTTAGNVYFGQLADSFYINGSNIISIDNKVTNGVVHIINRLNIPPNLKGNLQAVLNNTGLHSLFIAALNRASRWALLSGTSAFTIFAPTDVAMTAAGYTTATIATTPVTRMDSVVRYHMFSGPRLFTNDIGNSTTPGTFLGPAKTLSGSMNGKKIKGAGNASPIDIIKSDILGTNGVIHIINGVLRY